VIECRLFEQEAPLTVANFVGLARGLRPVRDPEQGTWAPRRFYDHTLFHRVLPGFLIQGGDPQGTGMGNTGYVLPDEIQPQRTHDAAGVLSMANRGPATASAQFFITLGPAPHLDGHHTVFGRCTDEGIAVADNIAMVPRDAADRPLEDQVLETVKIVRRTRRGTP
jgi:peptidyl-prolyl cis-trans isomerase A (cyclophilin A)